jgi:HK97 family phage prohead protease
MDIKLFEIDDIKTEQEEEKFYITGIANNKGIVDAYGDIPQGDNVYDLKRYKKNPVVLVDHTNSVGNIAGKMVKIKETEKGLEFKMRLMDNPQTDIAKHAVEAFKSGFGNALSIGGVWEYGETNEKKGTRILTKALIHEISLVGIGADSHALTDVPNPKSAPEVVKESRNADLKAMEAYVAGMRKIRVGDLS